MTLNQIMFVSAVLAGCCVALGWMLRGTRPPKTPGAVYKKDDSEQNLQMLAQVKDQFSLAVYKKVYNIEDRELQKTKTEAGGVVD